MASRRCALCGINYPAIAQFLECPIHGEATTTHASDPDADWKVRMERLAKQQAFDAEIADAIPRARNVEVVEENGQLFISQEALFRAGVKLRSWQTELHLVELDDGFIYELSGWDEPRRRWWAGRVVEVVEVPPELDVIVELAD